MSYYPIDTHATVREFEAAGIETKQAEAIVKAMTWSRNDLMTKTDLAGFATKEDIERFATKEDLEELKTRLDSLSAKMERIALQAYLEKLATKEDLAVVRAEMAAMKSDLEKQISGAVNKMMICMITMSALIVGMMKYL
ncbi:MAG: DUF1640 domain-containing protein [candidate division Zixibacteria bacterium]|nr:DUF1640 domain-containing protein [candidate division Zixibacteria bacterium]